MIKAILFDFAGVIDKADGHWAWIKEVYPNAEREKQNFRELDDKVDKGTISNEEYITQTSQITGVPTELVWPGIYKKIIINKELLDYIEDLKKRFKIGLFSNYTYEWLEEFIEKNHLTQYFDSIYISSRHGMIKPEKGAFRKALEILGVAPEEAVFVDDRQVNVEAANELSIKGILYTGVEQLKKDIHVIMF